MTRIRFVEDWAGAPWNLRLVVSRQRTFDGVPQREMEIVHSPTITQVKEDECLSFEPKPLLIIDRKDPGLQDLMDNLWQLGIRPTDIGTPGHLAATQEHLRDMKAIAFKFLGLKHDGKPLDS